MHVCGKLALLLLLLLAWFPRMRTRRHVCMSGIFEGKGFCACMCVRGDMRAELVLCINICDGERGERAMQVVRGKVLGD